MLVTGVHDRVDNGSWRLPTHIDGSPAKEPDPTSNRRQQVIGNVRPICHGEVRCPPPIKNSRNYAAPPAKRRLELAHPSRPGSQPTGADAGCRGHFGPHARALILCLWVFNSRNVSFMQVARARKGYQGPEGAPRPNQSTKGRDQVGAAAGSQCQESKGTAACNEVQAAEGTTANAPKKAHKVVFYTSRAYQARQGGGGGGFKDSPHVHDGSFQVIPGPHQTKANLCHSCRHDQ